MIAAVRTAVRAVGPRSALAAILAVGAANFLWQLGSPSYYVDEIEALGVALHPLGSLFHSLSGNEITPPAYFVFLHEWSARVGFSPEWVTRLPSAIAGVALVAAVYWLGVLFGGRRAVGLLAAAIAALSPYVLEYAQLAQNYMFLMVACACAVGAAVEAERASGGRRTAWLMAAAIASALALWLHYTAALVIGPLCVWVATRGSLSVRSRVAFAGACLAAAIAVIPLLIEQHSAIPARNGVRLTAAFTGTNVVRVLGTPFDGRADALLGLGTAAMVAALVWIVTAGRRVVGEWLLVSVLAAGVPVTLVVLSAFGADLLLTRYFAGAAPFMVAATAVALLAIRPPPLAALLAATVLVAAGAGLVASHQPSGFYFDARGIAKYVHAHERPGDAVLASGSAGTAIPLAYYGLRPASFGSVEADALLSAHRRRLWVVYELQHLTDRAGLARYLRNFARPRGYAVPDVRLFNGLVPAALVLDVPLRGRD